MGEYSYSTQKLTFEHIPNARELGGYRMADGRRIKRGLLLRGARLTHATDADIEKLHSQYNVTAVFDFRTEEEVSYAPDRKVAGSEFLWLPTIDPETDKLVGSSLPHEAYRNLPEYLVEHALDPIALKVAREMYPSLVHNEYSQLQYSSFLQMVSNNTGGAVYWHCSQGKDRTGLGAAFLLAALGADRNLIIDDFNISNEVYEDEMEMAYGKMRESGMEVGPVQREVVESFIGVSTDHFVKTLDEIDVRYGSLHDYLVNLLVFDDNDMAKLQSRFLE